MPSGFALAAFLFFAGNPPVSEKGRISFRTGVSNVPCREHDAGPAHESEPVEALFKPAGLSLVEHFARRDALSTS
jgi:hypothetical protein